jgi:carbon monoxide dehydrogenase subunit G
MELKHSFTVPVPLDRAWDVLLDVERVAPCMPGATLDSVDGDAIAGKIKVKVGPISMIYAGTARFTERNRDAGVVQLEASGKETRGAGTASASVRSELTGEGNETHVTVVTNLNVTGKPAQFGRGVLNEVGGKLIGIFAGNLAQMLAAEPAGAAEQAAQPASAEGSAAQGAATPAAEPATGDAKLAAAAEAGRGEPAAAQPATPAATASGDGSSAADDLALPIEELNLPLRAHNSLRREGVHTVGDLVARTPQDLLAIDNIGPASVDEIRRRLAERGLALNESTASANGAGGPVAAFGGPATPAAPAAPAHEPPIPLRPVPASSDAPWQADDDAIDLLSVAGFPVLKRALPVAAGVVALAAIALGLRRRRRRSGR